VGKDDGDPAAAPPGAAPLLAPWPADGVAPTDGPTDGEVLVGGTTLGVGDVLGLDVDDGRGVAGPVVAVPGVVALCRGVVPVGCGAMLPLPWFPVTTLPTVVPEPR
jgi:hypothetical protein